MCISECPLCTRKLQGHADEVAINLEKVSEQLNLTQVLIDLQTDLRETQNKLQKVEVSTH